MNDRKIHRTLRKHIRTFFDGHLVSEHKWNKGPIQRVLPRFRVMKIAPGPKTDLWVYASLGAWEAKHEDGGLLEFMIFAPKESQRHIELLAMAAHYHLTHRLGLGHTFPIGEPWLGDSRCDHMLVSLPYPFGPELEICNLNDRHIHLLWLLPITKDERDFKIEHGQEALEQLFDKSRLEYWRDDRESVIHTAVWPPNTHCT